MNRLRIFPIASFTSLAFFVAQTKALGGLVPFEGGLTIVTCGIEGSTYLNQLTVLGTSVQIYGSAIYMNLRPGRDAFFPREFFEGVNSFQENLYGEPVVPAEFANASGAMATSVGLTYFTNEEECPPFPSAEEPPPRDRGTCYDSGEYPPIYYDCTGSAPTGTDEVSKISWGFGIGSDYLS